jgi:pilus assembly protein CpaB
MGRRALVLLVALLLAGVAAFAVFRYLDGIRQEAEANRAKTTVYRATQFLPEGSEGSFVLQSNWIAEGEENVEDVPEQYVSSLEQLQAVVGGRLAVGPIEKNQIITSSQWAEITAEIKPLSELIPSGKQAITISTDAVRGVNGFIKPGDRINVIVTIDIEFNLIPVESPIFGIPTTQPSAEGGGAPADTQEVVTLTRYVLQGLPVLAVGRDVRPLEEDGQTPQITPTTIAGAEQAPEEVVQTIFTLEVTPEQAERLVFTFESGSTYLTLVPVDFVEVETTGITIERLFTGDLVEDIFGQG